MSLQMTANKKLIFGLVALTALLVLSAVLAPATSQAGPNFGITPTPTPAPTNPPPPPPDDDNDSDNPPPETLEVQLGCNLVCNVDGQTVQTQVQVQIIHRGSGWIVDGTISNDVSTRFQVPYPDEWDVYLVNQPQLAAGTQFAFDSTMPQHLGVIQANNGVQYVSCPLNCNTLPAPPAPPAPPDLPTTGADDVQHPYPYAFWILASGVISLSLGLGLYWYLVINRRKQQKD